MQICPRCNMKLRKAVLDGMFVWDCPLCSGRAVSIEVVRNLAPLATVRELWNQASSSTSISEARCPVCTKSMTGISLNISPSGTKLDICKSCRFIWFDRYEFQRLPAHSQTPPEQTLPLEARKAVALAKIESMKESRDQMIADDEPPDTWWQFGLGVLGIPVEYGTHDVRNVPFLTWGIAAFMVVMTLASLVDGSALMQNWALIPNQFSRHCGLTIFSSFFLHGGIAHLLGNLYFLLTCGDDVEDVLGHGRFLVLVFAAALLGDVAHILIDPHASTPVVGASGGISGLLAYYCLRFPNARVGFMWWFHWYRVRVGWMFVFWIAGQLLGAIQQVGGFSSVSSLAHLGGALAGLTFWWLESELGERRRGSVEGSDLRI